MTTFFIIFTSAFGLLTCIFAWGTWYANHQYHRHPSEGWNLSCLACLTATLLFGAITAIGVAAIVFAKM